MPPGRDDLPHLREGERQAMARQVSGPRCGQDTTARYHAVLYLGCPLAPAGFCKPGTGRDKVALGDAVVGSHSRDSCPTAAVRTA